MLVFDWLAARVKGWPETYQAQRWRDWKPAPRRLTRGAADIFDGYR